MIIREFEGIDPIFNTEGYTEMVEMIGEFDEYDCKRVIALDSGYKLEYLRKDMERDEHIDIRKMWARDYLKKLTF